MGAGPKVKCLTCLKIIQSMYRHDFVGCNCPYDSLTWIAVDGGDSYLKMSIKPAGSWEIVDEDKTEAV